MLRVIIVEDEPYAAGKLEMLLGKAGHSVEVAGIAATVTEAVKLIETHKDIDLGFFDIELADGLSFSVFDRCDVYFPVIFTTAYESYAIRAFKHYSIDYLLKPVRLPDLTAAIDKYKNMSQKFNAGSSRYLNVFNAGKSYKERFTVKVGDHIKMFVTTGIACFYSYEKGSFLLTAAGGNYLVDYSLDEIEEKVNPAKFFRVSRKHIINIDFIDDIIAYSGSRLKIKLNVATENDIIVSRQRVKEFRSWIGLGKG